MGITLPAGAVSPEAIGEALARVLASEELGNSKRLRRFLSYIVEKTVAEELNVVKEYNIALAVFDRQATFDPATDTIVRVEARRLRNQLATYYRGAGQSDPVVIEIPKGGYVPVFRSQRGEGRGAPSRRPIPFPGRRIWLWFAAGALILAALGLILWRAAIVSGYGVPKAWALDGTTLRVLDAHNRLCWEKTFGPFDTAFPSLVIDKALIADIDGDGRKEVLFNYVPQNARLSGGALLCFEQDGALRWQFHYGAAKTFGTRSFDSAYRGRLIRTVKVRGKPLLLTVANHYLWYPSQVALIDPRTGRVVEEYWHPGAIYDCVLHDIDADGEEEAIFAAINNPGEGLGHPAVGELALPFSKAPRRAVAPGDPFPPLTGGGELAYALLPLPDVDRVMGMLPVPANFKIDRARITVETPMPELGGIVYELDFHLNVIEYRFSDNFAVLHRRLTLQRLLDHPLTAEESECLGKVVRFPAAPDGNSPELKRFWKF
ncbi:MAG: hypothetical protein WBL61_21060 [Bryobacteraceae bacterium]